MAKLASSEGLLGSISGVDTQVKRIHDGESDARDISYLDTLNDISQ